MKTSWKPLQTIFQCWLAEGAPVRKPLPHPNAALSDAEAFRCWLTHFQQVNVSLHLHWRKCEWVNRPARRAASSDDTPEQVSEGGRGSFLCSCLLLLHLIPAGQVTVAVVSGHWRTPPSTDPQQSLLVQSSCPVAPAEPEELWGAHEWVLMKVMNFLPELQCLDFLDIKRFSPHFKVVF